MEPPHALPPGPALPALLQGLQYVFRPGRFFEACARRYGECFTMRMPVGPPIMIMFTHPDAIREVFTGNDDELRGGEAFVALQPLLGARSILALDGAHHQRERRLMMPPFHGERMLAYGDTMRAIADRAIDRWPIGRPFPVHREMQAITLEVILRTVFGAEGEGLDALRSLVLRFTRAAANPLWLWPPLQNDLGPLSPWGRFVRVKRDLDTFLFAEFARRRAAGSTGRNDILSFLLAARDEDGEPMCDEELRDQMLTLLFAGHDTTATSLAFAFYNILRHPGVLERLHHERVDVSGAGAVAPAQVGKLEYLDATVKETLRLNPIISDVGRVLVNPMRIGGWDLPAGVVASPCIYLTHRRPDLWPEPEHFDPERFLGRRPSPYEFFPFGGGMRRCLGMAFALYEMKVVLTAVLSRVELRLTTGYRMQRVRRSITLAPSHGMPVVVVRRAA
jgi:cytochrome P450 family 110